MLARWWGRVAVPVRALLLVLLLSLAWASVPAFVAARGSAPGADIALEALPPEAIRTLALIVQGGPFPYRKDGSVFANREQRLPRRARGYYTEYTVPTPGAPDRGARRIVAGDIAARRDEFWYTEDHYRSFRRIQPPRRGEGLDRAR